MRSQWKVINNSYKNMDGYKRVAWPPVSEERIVREFTPQPAATTPYPGAAVQQQNRASSYDSPQHNQQQYHLNQQHPNYQANKNANAAPAYPYQQPLPEWVNSQNQQQLQQQQLLQQHQQQKLQQQQQLQQQQLLQQHQQQKLQQQQQQQLNQQQQQVALPPYQQYQLPTQQQPVYNNHYTQRPQQEYESYPFNQYNLQPQHQAQDNQPLYNSYSQFQQQHQQQHQQPRNVSFSQDQLDQGPQVQALQHDYRGDSPGIIQLRKEVPVTQQPAPVYTSQPAAVSFQGGSNMRGDMKWPPQEYKEAAARENEERRKLALGPVCRPRKVKRDYSSFFAKNAINNHYPSYKVPPGTQHMLA